MYKVFYNQNSVAQIQELGANEYHQTKEKIIQMEQLARAAGGGHALIRSEPYGKDDAYEYTRRIYDYPEFPARYRRIKARRGHKKAIIVTYRMILTAIWHILTDLKPYTPDVFLERRPVNKSKILTTSQALNL